MTEHTLSLIELLEALGKRNHGILPQGEAIAIVRQHQAEQPQEVVERVAAAIYPHVKQRIEPRFETLWSDPNWDYHRKTYENAAKAAIAAMGSYSEKSLQPPKPDCSGYSVEHQCDATWEDIAMLKQENKILREQLQQREIPMVGDADLREIIISAMTDYEHDVHTGRRNGEGVYVEGEADYIIGAIRPYLCTTEPDEDNIGYLIVATVANNLDQHTWEDEWRKFYDPTKWLGSHRAAAVFLTEKMRKPVPVMVDLDDAVRVMWEAAKACAEAWGLKWK